MEIYDPLGLVARGPQGQLVSLASGFSFTEGPAADKHGNVYFTDQPNDKIYRWDAGSGKVTLWLEGTGRANGMIFDLDGNLIAAADMYGELWKIRPDGSHKVLVDNYQGKLLNGPNDVWINPNNGGIYLTDPIFPRGYWEAGDPRQQPWEPTRSEQSPQGKGGHVYYLPAGGRKLVRVTSDALGWESDAWPNGVVGTPDGKKLYVNKWYYDTRAAPGCSTSSVTAAWPTCASSATGVATACPWTRTAMSTSAMVKACWHSIRMATTSCASPRAAGRPTTLLPGGMAGRCSSPAPRIASPRSA